MTHEHSTDSTQHDQGLTTPPHHCTTPPPPPSITKIYQCPLSEFSLPALETRVPLAAILIASDTHHGWLYDDFIYNIKAEEWKEEFQSKALSFYCLGRTGNGQVIAIDSGKYGCHCHSEHTAGDDAIEQIYHYHLCLVLTDDESAITQDTQSLGLTWRSKVLKKSQGSSATRSSNCTQGKYTTTCACCTGVVEMNSLSLTWLETPSPAATAAAATSKKSNNDNKVRTSFTECFLGRRTSKPRLLQQCNLALQQSYDVKCGGNDVSITQYSSINGTSSGTLSPCNKSLPTLWNSADDKDGMRNMSSRSDETSETSTTEPSHNMFLATAGRRLRSAPHILNMHQADTFETEEAGSPIIRATKKMMKFKLSGLVRLSRSGRHASSPSNLSPHSSSASWDGCAPSPRSDALSFSDIISRKQKDAIVLDFSPTSEFRWRPLDDGVFS